MELKPKLQDYTESEFQTLVDKIWSVEANREDHNRLINHFDLIVDHPDGADLLFYPEDTFNSHSPGAVTFHLKHWYHLKRLIPFKDGVLPAPFTSVNGSSLIAYATARAKHELANAQRVATDIASAEQTVDSAFSLLQSAIQHLPLQQHSNATLEALEKGIRRIEHAQHEVLMAVRAFEGKKMRVEFETRHSEILPTARRTGRSGKPICSRPLPTRLIIWRVCPPTPSAMPNSTPTPKP